MQKIRGNSEKNLFFSAFPSCLPSHDPSAKSCVPSLSDSEDKMLHFPIVTSISEHYNQSDFTAAA